MIIPQFLRFYQGYTIDSLMNENAVTFFTLANAMKRIKAEEMLNMAHSVSIPQMDKQQRDNAVSELVRNTKGLHGIVEEVRTIRKIKK